MKNATFNFPSFAQKTGLTVNDFVTFLETASDLYRKPIVFSVIPVPVGTQARAVYSGGQLQEVFVQDNGVISQMDIERMNAVIGLPKALNFLEQKNTEMTIFGNLTKRADDGVEYFCYLFNDAEPPLTKACYAQLHTEYAKARADGFSCCNLAVTGGSSRRRWKKRISMFGSENAEVKRAHSILERHDARLKQFMDELKDAEQLAKQVELPLKGWIIMPESQLLRQREIYKANKDAFSFFLVS